MNDPHFKRVALLIGVLLAILAGSLYLFARPSPPAPVPATPAVAPAANSTLLQVGSASSTQPKITWSQNQIEAILSPGESTSRDLTFTSSLDLQNVVIEAVPEIAGFLSVQPKSFANISGGASNAVHISFSIPSGTTLGTYESTIHVRIGSSTLPQTLKAVVDVWNRLGGQAAGFALLYPPSFSPRQVTQPGATGTGFVLQATLGTAVTQGVPTSGSMQGTCKISIYALGKPSTSTLRDFAEQLRLASGEPAPDATSDDTINGFPALRQEAGETIPVDSVMLALSSSSVVAASLVCGSDVLTTGEFEFQKILSTISAP